jgi:phosphate-selective porin
VVPQQRDIRGYYGSVGYLFTPKIEGVFRYDYLDADRDLEVTHVRDLILGVNYYLKGNNAKLQANLIKRSGASALTPSSNPASDIVNDRTELRLQGQVAF